MTEPAICSPRSLPADQAIPAARVAVYHNPVNAPVQIGIQNVARIAVLTTKYWGPATRRLSTTFIGRKIPTELRLRIFTHLNAWASRGAKFNFYYTANPGAQVRIAFEPDGYWSYLGTDILSIPTDQPTMNLEGFGMSTPEEEFHRVIRHEAGHTLGFPHEHMRAEVISRIDPQRAYAYFHRTQGWSKKEVDQQVLTPLENTELIATPADQTSIMCYQLPGSIMSDGRPVLGGDDINTQDFTFVARIYPGVSR